MSGPTGSPPSRRATRILLCYWGRRGGVARFALELAKALDARRDVELCVSYSQQGELQGEFAALGCPQIPVRTFDSGWEAIMRLSGARAAASRVVSYAASWESDVILVPATHIWDLALLFRARRARLPYGLIVHDAFLHPGERNVVAERLLQAEIRRADALFTLSAYVCRQLTQLRPRAKPQHRWIVPLGVLTSRPAQPVATAARRRGAPLRLLHLGRQLPYQGPDLFVATLQELRRRRVGVEAVIAGRGLGGSLADKAARAGAKVIPGWLPEQEMEKLVADADLVVLPYREASQSGLVSLAYAFGVPVVATPVGGLPEQIRHGETGLVAHEVSASALADCIQQFADDRELHERCREAASKEALGPLSWGSVASIVAERLSEIVDDRERLETLE